MKHAVVFLNRKWLDRLPRVKSMLARQEAESARNPFYGWIKSFERLHETEIPYVERLKTAGELFTGSDRIVSIDKQIIALAALGRFLARNRSYDFASLVLGKLELLSFGIPNGLQHDASGLITDLLQEKWYRGLSKEEDHRVA